VRDNAFIISYLHRLATGQEYETFRWDGPHDGIVAIGRRTDLKKLPWKLIKLEDDLSLRNAYYIRADSGLDGWIIENSYRLRRFEQWFRVRFIVTLAVWGLARWHESTEPSWKDIGKR